MRILVVLGTRPEAIKLAPLVVELAARRGVEARVCLTGQHRELVAQVTAFFGTRLDFDLDLMRPDQSPTDVAARCLTGVQGVLRSWRPDWTVVQGDTTTAFAAAVASFYARVPVAHVEAGLRSHRLDAPFPEEGNRALIARVAAAHFAPTARAAANLAAEGIAAEAVEVVGNTGIDALLLARELIARRGLGASLAARVPGLDPRRPLVLVTGHRRESFGRPFEDLCGALRRVAREHDVEIVYPVHLNPSVREPVFRILGGLANVHLVEPVDYPTLVWLASSCRFIVTDSGGIQEEAAALGKPVLVLREVTERQESVEAGVSRLVGTDPARIAASCRELLRDEGAYRAMARALPLYGDGRASARIADALARGGEAAA